MQVSREPKLPSWLPHRPQTSTTALVFTAGHWFTQPGPTEGERPDLVTCQGPGAGKSMSLAAGLERAEANGLTQHEDGHEGDAERKLQGVSDALWGSEGGKL